jgi:hypothetical protein
MAWKRMIVVFGAGYVVGTRAGRERYDELVEFWQNVTGSRVADRVRESSDRAWKKIRQLAEQAAASARTEDTDQPETLQDDGRSRAHAGDGGTDGHDRRRRQRPERFSLDRIESGAGSLVRTARERGRVG